MSDPSSAPVVAAGAVCWREGRRGVEVLLIHRHRHDDVSLPKGKIEAGETIPEAAVREVREETGYSVALGLPLGSTEYVLPSGRDKVVYYWATEITREKLEKGRFRPNDEVDELEWVPVEKARKRLTYHRDADVVDRFQKFVARDHHRTFALIALRHAKADGGSPDGSDAARPLTSRGRQQASGLSRLLPAWGATTVLSSPAKRCVDTVSPLAKSLHVEVKAKRSLSQELWEGGVSDRADERLRSHVAKRIERRSATVLCTHSPVLPPLLDTVASMVGGERDGRLTRAGILATAEFTVVHLSSRDPSTGILALETHAPLA